MGSRSPIDACDGKKGSARSEKRIYRAPKLKVYGSVAELTHGMNGSNCDNGQRRAQNMAMARVWAVVLEPFDCR